MFQWLCLDIMDLGFKLSGGFSVFQIQRYNWTSSQAQIVFFYILVLMKKQEYEKKRKNWKRLSTLDS